MDFSTLIFHKSSPTNRKLRVSGRQNGFKTNPKSIRNQGRTKEGVFIGFWVVLSCFSDWPTFQFYAPTQCFLSFFEFLLFSLRICFGTKKRVTSAPKSLRNHGSNPFRKRKVFNCDFLVFLASISEGLGGQVGALWALWGPPWLFFGVFKSSFFSTICPRWAPRGLLGQSGTILGRIWEGSGRNLVAFGACQ